MTDVFYYVAYFIFFVLFFFCLFTFHAEKIRAFRGMDKYCFILSVFYC